MLASRKCPTISLTWTSVVTSATIILCWIGLIFPLTNSVSYFSWSTFEVYHSESESGFCSASKIKTSVELHQTIWLTVATTCPKWVLTHSFLSTPRLVKSLSPCFIYFWRDSLIASWTEFSHVSICPHTEGFFPLNGFFTFSR